MNDLARKKLDRSEREPGINDIAPTLPVRSLGLQSMLLFVAVAGIFSIAATDDVHAATRSFRNVKDCEAQMIAMSNRHIKEIKSFKIPKPSSTERQWCDYAKRTLARSERHLAETKAFEGSVCWTAYFVASLPDSEAILVKERAETAEDCAKADAADGKPAAATSKAAESDTSAGAARRAETEPQPPQRPVFRNKKDCGDKYFAMLIRHATAVGNIVETIPKPGSESGEFCTFLKTLNGQVARNLDEEQTFKGSVCWDVSNDQSLAASNKKLTDNRARQDKVCVDARVDKPKAGEDGTRAVEQSKEKPIEQPSQAWIWCEAKSGASLDLQIGGCTSVIQSGKETPEKLAVAFYNRGVAYFSKNEIEKSLADYNQSISIAPALAAAFNNRGYIYFSQAKHSLAIKDYDEALKLDEKYAQAFLNRGLAYAGLKQIDRAIEDYDQAIRLESKEPVFRARGYAYSQKNNFSRAVQDYDEAIKLDPKSSPAYFLRALSRESLNQRELAIEDYGQSIKFNPNFYNPYLLRGMLYSEDKKYDLAISDFDAAIRVSPGTAGLYRQRGIARERAGQVELAMEDYSAAIKFDSKEKYGFALRGSLYARMAKFDLAIQDFNRSLEIDPNNANALRQRSQAKARAGDAAGAEIDLEAAKKIDTSIK